MLPWVCPFLLLVCDHGLLDEKIRQWQWRFCFKFQGRWVEFMIWMAFGDLISSFPASNSTFFLTDHKPIHTELSTNETGRFPDFRILAHSVETAKLVELINRKFKSPVNGARKIRVHPRRASNRRNTNDAHCDTRRFVTGALRTSSTTREFGSLANPSPFPLRPDTPSLLSLLSVGGRFSILKSPPNSRPLSFSNALVRSYVPVRLTLTLHACLFTICRPHHSDQGQKTTENS